LALLQTVSQSLAGRTAVLHLLPMARSELVRFDRHPETLDEALFAGGYPRIFDREIAPSTWLSSYVATYVERDVRTITNVGDLTTFQRFLELAAGRAAQLLNVSALAADCGISQPTAKAWLSILETSFIAARLPAWHNNLRKRLVKMPKLHFHDTGLVCWLLGIRSPEHLRSHPLRGLIFETWVVSEIRKHRTNAGEAGGISFYRDGDGVEADLIVERGGSRIVVEAKASQTASSSLFGSVRRVRGLIDRAADDASDAVVVYGGDEPQVRGDVELIPWRNLHERRWV